MRSKLVQFRMTWELYDKTRQHYEKLGFHDLGGYLTALVMLDLGHDQRWQWLKALANSRKRKLQDLVIEQFFILGISPDEVTFLAQALEAKRKGNRRIGL